MVDNNNNNNNNNNSKDTRLFQNRVEQKNPTSLPLYFFSLLETLISCGERNKREEGDITFLSFFLSFYSCWKVLYLVFVLYCIVKVFASIQYGSITIRHKREQKHRLDSIHKVSGK